jgi:hypothetical protein
VSGVTISSAARRGGYGIGRGHSSPFTYVSISYLFPSGNGLGGIVQILTPLKLTIRAIVTTSCAPIDLVKGHISIDKIEQMYIICPK